MIRKIASGGRFLLADDMGDINIYEITVTFKDGTQSGYDVEHLRDATIQRYLRQDILSLANNGGFRGKGNIEVFGGISDTHLTATFDFQDLVKTAEFGGQGKKGGKTNKGNDYEKDLFESCEHYFEAGGPYPEHAKQIIDKISKATKLTFKGAKHAGGDNSSRPLRMRGANDIYISAGGSTTLDMGKTLTDITLLFGPAGGKPTKEIYLSVKMGDTLSFFNCGVRGGGKDNLSLFPTTSFKTGDIPPAGLAYLNMFGIESEDFQTVFKEYVGKDAGKTTVNNHRRKVTLKPSGVRALKRLIASGVGYGYWMVHYTGTDVHCYEVDKRYMANSSALTGNEIEIHYGGVNGKGKRVDILFETKNYEFKFNIRSKSGGETFPTHTNGDYYKK
jgi:hypothetical protein